MIRMLELTQKHRQAVSCGRSSLHRSTAKLLAVAARKCSTAALPRLSRKGPGGLTVRSGLKRERAGVGADFKGEANCAASMLLIKMHAYFITGTKPRGVEHMHKRRRI